MDETQDEKVAALRKSLRDARRTEQSNAAEQSQGVGTDSLSVSDATGVVEQYVATGTGSFQRTEHDVPGQNNRTVRPAGTTHQSQRKLDHGPRKPAQVHSGVRSEPGRHGNDSGQNGSGGVDVSTGSSAGQRTGVVQLGNLESVPNEYIPPRTFTTTNDSTPAATTPTPQTAGTFLKRKRGRPAKERPPVADVTPEEKQEPLKSVGQRLKAAIPTGGSRLTKQEAKELKEPLIEALTDEFQTFDRMLWGYANDPLEQPIWSDMTEREMESLVNTFLSLGQKSPSVATVARGAVDIQDYIVAGVIAVPRLKKTMDVVRQARKARTKQKRRE